MFHETGYRCSPCQATDDSDSEEHTVFPDDVTDGVKMKTNTRIMTLWAGVILIWTCCLFMTCLFLNDVICAEEELCEHVDDDVAPLGDSRKSGIFKEYYEDLANDSDLADVIELRTPHRIVLLYRKNVTKPWTIPEGDFVFRRHLCPVAGCVLSHDVNDRISADAILLRAADIQSRDDAPEEKPTNQIWLLTLTQPPDHVRHNLSALDGLVNWTSTYSDVSDIHRPFGVYRPYDDIGNNLDADWERVLSAWSPDDAGNSSTGENAAKKSPKYAARWNSSVLATKSRLVAMFTNDCKLSPGHRAYVEELGRHIRVDLYGNCNHRSCGTRKQCLEMLRASYKFYLAFEDSACSQYITEKFWRLALGHDVVPVVMGPSRVDYERVAPPDSFLHVADFRSPRHLASELVRLARNGSLYERFFDWKWRGYVQQSAQTTGDHNFWCHLCARLHNKTLISASQVYYRLDKWWSYHNQCAR